MIPEEKRAYFRQVGMTDEQIDEIEDNLEKAAKEARAQGLEFKSKNARSEALDPFFRGLVKSLDIDLFKEDIAMTDHTFQTATQTLETYTSRTPLGTVHEAVMGSIYREEVVKRIAVELEEILGDVDAEILRDQILIALRSMENAEE